MHHALCIDEILQNIFSSCTNVDLAKAATVSKTWKNPAQDTLWRILPSYKPLLDLIPGLMRVKNVYSLSGTTLDLDVEHFFTFSSRVRKITHSDHVQVDETAQLALLAAHVTILPNLKQLRATNLRSTTHRLPFGPSPSLHTLYLDLGFKPSPETATHVSNYMEDVIVCSPVRTLTIRGILTPQMNDALCRMHALSSLTLRTGTFLLPNTIRELSTLSTLQSLELHADHIDIDDIPGTFPSLHSLSVRGQPAFIQKLLRSVPRNQLETLHIDLISPNIDSWDNIFHDIRTCAKHSLRELFIAQQIESDSEEAEDTTEGDDTMIQSSDIPTIALTLLGDLPMLHTLVVDTSSPVSIPKPDLWPNLVQLDLGSSHDPLICVAGAQTGATREAASSL